MCVCLSVYICVPGVQESLEMMGALDPLGLDHHVVSQTELRPFESNRRS